MNYHTGKMLVILAFLVLSAGPLYAYPDSLEVSVVIAQKTERSIPLAFALSAVVPGAGQAYNRQWVKSAGALLLEAALWTGYIGWKNQGLDQERAFERYAHAHWNPVDYAHWLNRFLVETRGFETGPVSVLQGIDFRFPDRWSDADRQAIHGFFNQIREAEKHARHLNTGAVFSHQLPFFGEQQYYELIGKYFQYAPGWDDYAGALDPEETDGNGNKVNVSARFHEYARIHADANTLLRRASRITTLILLNHFVSAFDAAIFAKLHNDRLQTGLSLGSDMRGDPVPMATVRLQF